MDFQQGEKSLRCASLFRRIHPLAGFALLWAFFCAFAVDLPDLKSASKMLPGVLPDEQVRVPEFQADNSIDPETYQIGGGDAFQISVVELPSVRYSGTVNENCDVYIPDLGIIKIGRTTLSRAKKTIANFVGSKLSKKYDVYVSLVKTKTAVLTVSGAVSAPGTYRLSGTFRLLDAIKTANNGELPSLTEYDYREVECRNRDSLRLCDVFKFLFKNDLTQNPYVYPGDNILLSYAKSRVYLLGSVKNPVAGPVPIKQDEPLAEFLSLFTFDASADSGRIMVQRSPAENAVYSLARPEPFLLRDRDLVIVSEKENYPQVTAVSVKGEVKRPGAYPLVMNVTKASDVLDLAGGPTKTGNIDRAFVIRNKKIPAEELKQGNGSKAAASGTPPEHSVRPEINAGYFHMNLSGDYSIIRLRDCKNGLLLEANDEIVVPQKEYCVYVSGSVCHPGAYAFAAGKGRDYYIGQAGGYSSRADRSNVFVVTYYESLAQQKENGELEEGDVIVVPDSQQYKFLSMVFIPILSAIAITLSTILALYTSVHR
ncbi:MAG TPA: SLBB domain-containing protein [Chitinivibrionales bacterium]|nr:SLBB domain-containing protein [Chitinivibrionales bacterium]